MPKRIPSNQQLTDGKALARNGEGDGLDTGGPGALCKGNVGVADLDISHALSNRKEKRQRQRQETERPAKSGKQHLSEREREKEKNKDLLCVEIDRGRRCHVPQTRISGAGCNYIIGSVMQESVMQEKGQFTHTHAHDSNEEGLLKSAAQLMHRYPRVVLNLYPVLHRAPASNPQELMVHYPIGTRLRRNYSPQN